MLQAMWCLRCQCTADPDRHAVTPAADVGATIAAVKRLMRLDYKRTVGDARTMTASPRHWSWGTSVLSSRPQMSSPDGRVTAMPSAHCRLQTLLGKAVT